VFVSLAEKKTTHTQREGMNIEIGKNFARVAALFALLTLTAAVSEADVLELKDGRVLEGKYVGGTAGTIRFESSGGVQVFETSQALALTFTLGAAPAETPAPAPAAVTPASAAAPALTAGTPVPAAAADSVVVPAGTALLVRMLDGASSSDKEGKRFTTRLETDLVVNGSVVARAGTKAYGLVENAQKAGRFVGKSKLDLRLTELNVNGALVQIRTDVVSEAGQGSLGKTAKGAVTGAAIGGIADGSDGAEDGAGYGAVASGLKKGESVEMPPGTLLEFRLEQPVAVSIVFSAPESAAEPFMNSMPSNRGPTRSRRWF
jgi:hypothetical protein